MAATRKDCGNSWASRAPLNDDRASIVARRPSWSKQQFQAEPAAGGPGGWFCRLLTGGLTIRRQTTALRAHLASDVGTDCQKIFFVE